jgi:hypothetical protein
MDNNKIKIVPPQYQPNILRYTPQKKHKTLILIHKSPKNHWKNFEHRFFIRQWEVNFATIFKNTYKSLYTICRLIAFYTLVC